MTPPHSLTPSHFFKISALCSLKNIFSYFFYSFFAACVNPRLVRSEPELNRTNRNRFCSVPRFVKNRSVPICREPNLCHKPKNRTETDQLTERPGRMAAARHEPTACHPPRSPETPMIATQSSPGQHHILDYRVE